MINTNCPHRHMGVAVCYNSGCANRIICQDHECFQLHSHGSYKLEVVMMQTIREKRLRARLLFEDIYKTVEEALNRCRKNIEMGLSSFFNESRRIYEFDLNPINMNQLRAFMEADHENQQFPTDLRKSLDRICSQTNSFREECFKKYQEDKTTQPLGMQSESRSKRKKKRDEKQLQTAETTNDFVKAIYLAESPQGLRRLSRCVSSVVPEVHSLPTAETLYSLLTEQNLKVEQQLYVGSQSRYELTQMIKVLESRGSNLVLISCESMHPPEQYLYGMFLSEPLARVHRSGSRLDFMFRVRPDRHELYRCLYDEDEVRSNGTIGVVDSLLGPDLFSLSFGLSEFVIPNQFSRYRSQVLRTGMFGLGSQMSVQVKEIELFSVKKTSGGEEELRALSSLPNPLRFSEVGIEDIQDEQTTQASRFIPVDEITDYRAEEN